MHEPIHVEQISQQAYFSRFHFHWMFTRIYRRTPHTYLTSKRLEKAKRLLEQEGIGIQEVCNSVGFESLASFNLLFSKHEGIAPQFYRNVAYIKNKLAKEQAQRFIPNCIVQNVVALQTSIDE